MALKGTIRDFGVADIFQLIGQQRKSGVLFLRGGAGEVRVDFIDGAVIRAHPAKRPKQMLIGTMLLRAGLITEDELQTALQIQGRTLQRLGCVLAEMGAVDEQTMEEFARLQTTETVYRLFAWTTGTYEFEQAVVDPPVGGTIPIAAEHILMEAVRMLDEWPAIRSRLPGVRVVLERAKPLPLAPASSAGDEASSRIGDPERRVYALLEEPTGVERLVERSRLGEFETCRAVVTLLEGGHVREAVDLTARSRRHGGRRWPRHWRPGLVLGRAAGYLFLLGVFLAMVRGFDGSRFGVAWRGTTRYDARAIERYLSIAQIRLLERALEVYRLESGTYPSELGALVREALVGERDLAFPNEDPYSYSVVNGTVRLAPPIE